MRKQKFGDSEEIGSTINEAVVLNRICSDCHPCLDKRKIKRAYIYIPFSPNNSQTLMT